MGPSPGFLCWATSEGRITMSKGIRLSQKHGVNPSVLVCPLCFRDTGVGLLGRLKDDAEAPRTMRDAEPCQECKEHLALGFLLIERDGNQITGRRWVLKKE